MCGRNENRACDLMSQHTNVKLLYEANDFPVFQNRMYHSSKDAIASPKGDIRLVENLETGLVYNEAFRPELLVYDDNYQNEQAVSPLFQQHLNTITQIIKKNMGQVDLVEVGCGKGFFLEMLLDRGFEVTGFDPTYEGDNPEIKKHYFVPGLGIKAKGIILRHVLEHIQDPVNFLTSLRDANGGSGLIYIEVPCFDWICQKKAWFDVFYEHVNYFRISDFYRIFENVIESGKGFGEQYLYIIADLASLKIPKIDHKDRANFPSNFLATLQKQNGTNLNRVAVWGGASKGVIFSLLKSRTGQSIKIVIDINPAKQGKYIAGTGLRVLSADEGLSKLPDGSMIYVMNSNYLKEIKKMSKNAYKYVSVDHE